MLVEIRERHNVNLPRVNSQGEVNMRVKEGMSAKCYFQCPCYSFLGFLQELASC